MRGGSPEIDVWGVAQWWGAGPEEDLLGVDPVLCSVVEHLHALLESVAGSGVVVPLAEERPVPQAEFVDGQVGDEQNGD